MGTTYGILCQGLHTFSHDTLVAYEAAFLTRVLGLWTLSGEVPELAKAGSLLVLQRGDHLLEGWRASNQ
eukprot:scaffold141603_cov32-Tisochrysis_lutea.AAC.1